MGRLSAAALATVLLALANTGGAAEPKRVSGQGGFPLTDAVTSMWGAIDEIASDQRPKPLTFMIYFSGTPGWHKGKWTFSSDVNQNPAFIEFVGPVSLRAEFDRESMRLKLFGQEYSVLEANVFLVHNVDQAERRKVAAIGHFDLGVPADANPAAYIVQQFPKVRDAVFPSAK